VKVLDQIVNVLLAQTPVKSRHRSAAIYDGIANLFVGRRRPAWQQLRTEKSGQFGRLLFQIRIGLVVAIRTVPIEENSAALLRGAPAKTHLGAAGQMERCGTETAGEAGPSQAVAHRFMPAAPIVATEAADLACCRSASSSSAAVHAVAQYWATEPSGVSSTMSIECEI